MRALGPGSVSSFLKIILDVAYYLILVVFVGLGIATVAGLLAYAFVPDWVQAVSGRVKIEGDSFSPAMLGALMGVIAAYGAVYLAALMVILNRLRRVFGTLTAGDPFEPENIRRLRLIGFVLAGMEIGRYLLRALLTALAPEASWDIDGFNVTVWFSVLVVFVLAEVFREGARLRREAELTI